MYNMDMRSALKADRLRKGLSQRALAGKAGLAYKTLQLLESGRHDPRWSTLEKLAAALGEPISCLFEQPGSAATSIAATSARMAEDESAWSLELFDFVDEFRRRPTVDLVAAAPDPRLGARLRALVSATVEALCAERGLRAPWWCGAAAPLEEPWFVAGVESLKAMALVESPEAFRKRNIFVLDNFLDRA